MDIPDLPVHSVEHPLITTISHVGGIVESELDHTLSTVGLSITQLSALNHICESKEPVALSELAKEKSCVKSNITQLIDRMEAKGLVERVRSEEDRRKVLTAITSKGEELYHEGMKLLKSTENKILSRLSPQQKKQLAELLHLISED